MSLAARCPSCGTVFRVVQDQLRVSEGWVRCGRCAEVFNAIESLVDLDTEVAAAKPAHSSPPARRHAERVLEELESISRFDEGPDDALSPLSTFGTPEAPAKVRDSMQTARSSTSPGSDPGRSAASAPVAHSAGGPSLRTPSFVRQADRAARWRRPGVRLALGTIAIAAALTLAVQVGLEYRNLVAARWPALQPFLAGACALAECRIDAPRMIEALAVESSGLVRIESTSLYRLTVVLRNRATVALALPALDLTLTDSQGGVMARRVITAAELGAQRTSLPAATELPLQATLNATDRPISGYTIEIFYP